MAVENDTSDPLQAPEHGGAQTVNSTQVVDSTQAVDVTAPASTGQVSLEPEPVENLPEDITDSAIGSESSSVRSASITSSIAGFKYENGRRYHAYREGAYYLPNDEAEQARLDLIHHIWRLALDGGLLHAPLPKQEIRRVLDFGTGTGIWAIDFADEHPEADVLGTDLSPIQPSWIPPNLRFFVDDVEAEWAYPESEKFDVIHGRGMVGAIASWPALFRQIRNNLQPGGLVEMQEYEGWLFSNKDFSGTDTSKWQNLVNEASSKFGKELDVARKIKPMLEEAGFVDVREHLVRIPVGPWAKGRRNKEMGMYQREHICDCVDSYTIALFTRVLDWSLSECQVMMAKVKAEIRDPKLQLYTNFFFVSGRAPGGE